MLKTKIDFYPDGTTWCEGTLEYCTCHIDSYNCLYCENEIQKRIQKDRNRKRRNLTIVAIYNSLFYDNRDRKKALVTITIGDESIDSLIRLRKDFINSIKARMKTKAFKGEKLAYFTNIEFGQDIGRLKRFFNPHLHMQLFYDSNLVMEEVRKYLENNQTKFKNFDIQESKNNDAYFAYVVKDYFEENYNREYEENKRSLGRGRAFYTASQKSISNYAIRYIYDYYRK